MTYRRQISIVLACLLLAACTYKVLPSFAMQVQLRPGDSPQEVLSVVHAYLASRGYPREGRGGYDEINGTDTVVSYGSMAKVDIAVGLDRSTYVPIRVTYSGPEQQGEATRMFNALRSNLSHRWAVRNVP